MPHPVSNSRRKHKGENIAFGQVILTGGDADNTRSLSAQRNDDRRQLDQFSNGSEANKHSHDGRDQKKRVGCRCTAEVCNKSTQTSRVLEW